jgi:hypothetical protein
LYYKYRKLRRAREQLSPDGPCPFIIIPEYRIGSGGTDKPDNPEEKRFLGDQAAPHPEQGIRERNKPHGPPDGPLLESMNDMMGPPPGTVPRGTMLDPERYPMPHPESKPRPRHEYNDSAVLNHMALAAETYVAGSKHDGRHMFFQFEMAPQDERTCVFQVIIALPVLDGDGVPLLDADGEQLYELWFIVLVATCMNMGSRNASKIAQRFTDRLLEGYSQQMDVYVRDVWLPRQTPALRELLAERAAVLGHHHGRPFTTSGYTDDYILKFVGPELAAAGTLIWIQVCAACNFWLSSKEGAGTVIDYIGGRQVLNGGFGCLPPTKHSRALADTRAAAESRLTRDELASHVSFLVHVHDWLDFPEGTLKGLSAPLKLPGTGEQLAAVGKAEREQFNAIIGLLRTRNAASFWSGIQEAADRRDGGLMGVDSIVFAPRFASDSCSDVLQPYVCGAAGGLFFRFPLDGRWRRKHITLTEACGTVLTLIIFEAYFPEY